MSFLLCDEDEQQTLLEALAFVDACEAPSNTAESLDLGIDKERRRATDARRRRRRKKERQALQTEVVALEWRLAQLKHVAHCQRSGPSNPDMPNAVAAADSNSSLQVTGTGETALPSGCSWEQTASALLQQRIDTEMRNMALRKALTSELKWLGTLREVFDKQPKRQKTELARAELQRAQTLSSNGFCFEPSAVMHELKLLVNDGLILVKAESPPATEISGSPPSISCNLNVRLDSMKGPTTELSSVTPLACGLEVAREFLRSKFQTHVSREGPQTRELSQQMKMRRINVEGSIEKQFTMVQEPRDDNVVLDGFGTMRMFDEDSRTFIVHASKSFHRSGSLFFLTTGWIKASREASNSSDGSVIRSCFTLYAKKAEGCTTADGEDINCMRNRILRCMGEQMRAKTLAFQQRLLSQTGQDDLVDFLADPTY